MHTERDANRLLARVRRIKGQVEAIEHGLASRHPCGGILQQIAACRGAINGLMSVIIEGHIREHVLDPHQSISAQRTQAAEELIDVVKAYLK
ncbi:MAG: metal/formaldehyde-sensitive transcriptional repressor [Phycisphaerales bacterium]